MVVTVAQLAELRQIQLGTPEQKVAKIAGEWLDSYTGFPGTTHVGFVAPDLHLDISDIGKVAQSWHNSARGDPCPIRNLTAMP